MKIELKAYQINTRNLDHNHESVYRGYIMDAIYGKTEHEARRKALSVCFENGIEETYMDEPLTYIKVKIKRFPEMDKFLIDGKLKTQRQIDYDKRVEENKDMLNKMLNDYPNGYAYIRKGGYYYSPNKCGYTERQTDAGVYTIKDAVKECLGCGLDDYMRPILIDIEEHNKLIKQKISALQSRLL